MGSYVATAIAAWVLSIQGTASAQTVTCSPNEFPRSLVRIERDAPAAPGTGVVIVKRDTYAVILTAKHVIGSPSDGGGSDIRVYFQVAPTQRIQVRWTDRTVFGFPPDVDLVVFRVDGRIPDGVTPADPSNGELPDRATLISWGYPTARRPGTLCSHEGALTATAGGQIVADGYVEPGVSGGPMFVIDPTSRVPRLAGIVVRGDGTVKSGTTQAIDIGQAVAIVRRSPDPANGGNPHVWPNIVLPDAIDVDAGLRRFVRVPGGGFSMGGNSGDERWPPSGSGSAGNLILPVFYMGKFEVTVAQFNECVRAGACLPPAPSGLSTAPDYPVTGVTWYEARKYATWLQQRLASSPETPLDLRRLLDVGWEIDLPSEAEWEKAARRNGKDPYPWGTSPNPSKANYNSGAVKAVGSSRCTDCAYGLEDMAGNVREWTRSLKLNYPYDAAKAEDPAATGPRAVRGGSYQRLFVGAERVRAANREEADPTHLDEYTGFRVAVICREERGCTWQEPD